MNEIIDADFCVTWQSPVFVRIGNGMRERLDSPDAALAALLHRWPSSYGSEYEVAKRRCVDAIASHGSPELARRAFVEAAVAAKLLA
ncbi:DUF982 domain-containing protein [Rhizobium leguminosarum]|jgi:hypothetical protein|uniref:DUF982 domain-containing protein n=1 Tax=Rhizobium leguminosarum bv. trifolii (strain WSM1325) TaxID=395491 RepID=C6B866_RHILS|nr:DUF982 domain-containing protein [Rhizobium leguminosarum]ACS60598.1 protein of unknown function DUF982 [Rhizobium leguminosarum bv. trifolii WSM1325]MBY2910157.1 DUF982 domain-containing protein [Rhizobium leguminosarum]MBY2917735.1 DUF982 domain-containing protein [Rhizobium leguminosarum]MBY2925387.1 DUF982 domain-containing protein [Rhizobium leguminosarum]MBY2936306.1 DUF982 domain-containing protein [Rhizobium leguminosarum]